MFAARVRDVMSSPVITIGPDASLREAVHLLLEHSISGLPVVDDFGQVMGLLSETDLLAKESGPNIVRHRPLAWFLGESPAAQAEDAKIHALSVSEAMTAPVIVIGPDDTVHEAAELMVRRGVNRLPVIEEGRLVGIVTRADVIRSLLRPDDVLAATIREDIVRKVLWMEPEAIEVHVADGLVSLDGTVDRRSTSELLERLARQVDGVLGVDNTLSWQLDDSDIEVPDKDLVWPPGGR